jgi:GAF domain-containing protein
MKSLVRNTRERALRMLDERAPLREILTQIVATAESVGGPGCVSSILLLDPDGLLRNGASPNLPVDYLDAIDRLKPHPQLGTCAAAAATGRTVMTPSFQADDKWAELRHLPMALGFVGAWSMPIKSREGRILGTLGTYYRDERVPTRDEQDAIAELAATAAVAVESHSPRAATRIS